MKDLCKTHQTSLQYSLCELEGLKIISKPYLGGDYLRPDQGCIYEFLKTVVFLSKHLEFLLLHIIRVYETLTVYGYAIYFSYTIWHNLSFSILLTT